MAPITNVPPKPVTHDDLASADAQIAFWKSRVDYWIDAKVGQRYDMTVLAGLSNACEALREQKAIRAGMWERYGNENS